MRWEIGEVPELAYTLYYGVHHTPLYRVAMVDISTVGSRAGTALEMSRRELSRDVPFGVGTLLVVEQSNLENRPRGVGCIPS